jgi:hypothetical protein
MKLSQLPPAEQAAAIERMIRDLFAGLDPADRANQDGWSWLWLPSLAAGRNAIADARLFQKGISLD